MNKILLIGITGQLGQELQHTLAPLGKVIGLSRQGLDLSQPNKIRQAIAAIKPNIIVNAAAYTAVDRAETEPELAKAINSVAPTVMAEEAQKRGATLVHISTDYVFDGRNYTPYTEADSPNPIGVYGKSKLMGEEGVRKNCARHLILRTAWVYGSRGHGNFVKTMVRLGGEREELRVVADQIGTPTWSYDLAKAIAQLLSSYTEEVEISMGTYHFTNSGVASWYDFAIAIFAEAQPLGFPLKIKRVAPITTAEYPTPARRPAYSVLSKVKIAKVLGDYPPYWRDSLKQMLVQWRSLN
ncbi:dTDP-4-dehydrorhamnose reductase [Pleurocapsales cyanobacterium LEGE 06147]|nr:dTDP-4-dehydrorhamnose reductase [Pleurocapsales cyanobacterium LEGE 06147]